MSLGSLFLDWGLEVELRADMKDVVGLLDNVMYDFSYDGYKYWISSSKGIVGSQWKLLVKLWDTSTSIQPTLTIGYLEIDKLDNGETRFMIPPRDEWGDDKSKAFDSEGRFFSGFVYHLLNTFQNRGMMDLPGPLPVR
jgi:hypothetical protein